MKLTEFCTEAAAPANALATWLVEGMRQHWVTDRCKLGADVLLATMRTSKNYVVGDS